MWFREELTGHSSDELNQIKEELAAIREGTVVLSNAEKQQLSNLSSADLHQYLGSLGLSIEDLTFPLLDVGTGQDAYFAQDVLRLYPEQRVVSTSMHLMNPNSVMSRRLADQIDRGELIACDGQNLPIEDETFAMVVSLNADPYYVPRASLEDTIREKHRVLKVGGAALLCPAVCEYGSHDISQDDLATLQDEVDVSIQQIPRSGHQYYDIKTRAMLVINK